MTNDLISDSGIACKSFMESLWGSEGNFIDTKLGRGRIDAVRTKAGQDLEVIVKIPDLDGFTLFSGLDLWINDAKLIDELNMEI